MCVQNIIKKLYIAPKPYIQISFAVCVFISPFSVFLNIHRNHIKKHKKNELHNHISKVKKIQKLTEKKFSYPTKYKKGKPVR